MSPFFQNLNISRAVYKSNWTEMTNEEKRELMMIMSRSQKPLFMQFGIFKAILTTFTDVRF